MSYFSAKSHGKTRETNAQESHAACHKPPFAHRLMGAVLVLEPAAAAPEPSAAAQVRPGAILLEEFLVLRHHVAVDRFFRTRPFETKSACSFSSLKGLRSMESCSSPSRFIVSVGVLPRIQVMVTPS